MVITLLWNEEADGKIETTQTFLKTNCVGAHLVLVILLDFFSDGKTHLNIHSHKDTYFKTQPLHYAQRCLLEIV